MISNVFNVDDNDVPYGLAIARPEVCLAVSMEYHIPGRYLNSLLSTKDRLSKHTLAAFLSFRSPRPLGRTKDSRTQKSLVCIMYGRYFMPVSFWKNAAAPRRIENWPIPVIRRSWSTRAL